MSLSDRRAVLLGLGALALLPACRFEPALQAGRGSLAPLYGQIEMTEPGSPTAFIMTRQLEDRMGRGGQAAPFVLDYRTRVSTSSLGTDRQGEGQRIHLRGRAEYDLRRRGETGVLAQGTVAQFTGYSATGNTVSTRAAETAARERLAIMLADGIVERLLLASRDLPL